MIDNKDVGNLMWCGVQLESAARQTEEITNESVATLYNLAKEIRQVVDNLIDEVLEKQPSFRPN